MYIGEPVVSPNASLPLDGVIDSVIEIYKVGRPDLLSQLFPRD